MWFLMMPYIRYGGYAYLPFGLLILQYSFFYKSYNLSKITKIFLIISIVFFISKNFLRINKEVNNLNSFTIDYLKTKQSFPIPFYKEIDVQEKLIHNNKIYISRHNWVCSTSSLPCLPGFWENLKINIKNKKGYNFIFVNEQDYIDILINKTKVYNLNKNRYGNSFNTDIRSK